MTDTHPIVPPSKMPSAWREAAEDYEERAESTPDTFGSCDKVEWQALADAKRECADDLERSLAEHDTREAQALREMEALYSVIMEDEHLSGADVAAILYESLGRLGMMVP